MSHSESKDQTVTFTTIKPDVAGCHHDYEDYEIDNGDPEVPNKHGYQFNVIVEDVEAHTFSDTETILIELIDQDEPPAPPINLVIDRGPSRFKATWGPPDVVAMVGVPPIIHYEAEFKPANSPTWSSRDVMAPDTSITPSTLDERSNYDFRVRSVNHEGESGWLEAPRITTLSSPTINGLGAIYNAPENITQVATFTTSDLDGDAITTRIDGPDSHLFDLATDVNDHTLSFKTEPNFEDPPVAGQLDYHIQVIAESGDPANTTWVNVAKDVTINLQDADDPPTGEVTISGALEELSLLSSDVTNVTDEDDILSWSYRWQRTSNQNIPCSNTYANISTNATSESYTLVAADAGKYIRLKATYDQTTWPDKALCSAFTGPVVGNAQPDITTNSPISVVENTNVVATLTATDSNSQDSLFVWSLHNVNDGQLFTLTESGDLTFKVAPDFEGRVPSASDNEYHVTVKVISGTASREQTTTKPLEINVIDDDNERPDKPATPSIVDARTKQLQLTLRWTKPGNKGPEITSYKIQYRLATATVWPANAQHTHTGANPTDTDIPNLARATSYHFRVRAISPEGPSEWSDHVEGTTLDNQEPTLPSGPITRSVDENTPSGTEITPTINAQDNDHNDGGTYTFTLEGTDAASFSIRQRLGNNSNQVWIQTKAPLDHEDKDSYSVTLKVEDGQTGSDTVIVNISVTDVAEPPSAPDAPTVSSSGLNRSLLVTWNAPSNTGKPILTDYDVQYRLRNSGNWVLHDHIGTGTTATITNLTAGTSYQVQIKAKSHEGESAWSPSGTGQARANARPTFGNNGADIIRNLDETIGNATTVTATGIGGPITATDPDYGTLSYAISGTNRNKFTFDTATGQISTKPGEQYDFETKEQYSVNVTATDDHSDGTSDSTTVTVKINITNLVEVPPQMVAVTFGSTTRFKTTVEWTAPDDIGRPSITGYTIEYDDQDDFSSSTTVTASDTSTSKEITGLTHSTGYHFRIHATNADGDGLPLGFSRKNNRRRPNCRFRPRHRRKKPGRELKHRHSSRTNHKSHRRRRRRHHQIRDRHRQRQRQYRQVSPSTPATVSSKLAPSPTTSSLEPYPTHSRSKPLAPHHQLKVQRKHPPRKP